MQTNLADFIKGTRDGNEAEAILRTCVHCGFCTATCPTYQLLGDELDGPRGRIYLIKQVLEGAEPTRKTQLHLDRCLTCRNCETTCPSGVKYGRLVDIGRKLVDERVARPWASGSRARLLKACLPQRACSRRHSGPGSLAAAAVAGRRCRPRCRPCPRPAAGRRAAIARKMLVLDGCVQPGDGAQHQRCHRARARRTGRAADRGAQGRLLRRAALSPERPGRRAGRHAPQYRRVVAQR